MAGINQAFFQNQKQGSLVPFFPAFVRFKFEKLKPMIQKEFVDKSQ
jgi:hypothetical protein